MKQKKKIIHFHPNGDMARHFIKPLIDAEREAGYISALVVSTKSDAVDAIFMPYDLNLKNVLSLMPTFFRVYLLLLKERPDVLVTHNSKSSSIILICAWLANVPKRIYFNHGVPYIGYTGLIKGTLKLFERINLFFSTRVLTVSKDMLLILQELSGKKSIHIIDEGSACGLDLSQYGFKKYQN